MSRLRLHPIASTKKDRLWRGSLSWDTVTISVVTADEPKNFLSTARGDHQGSLFFFCLNYTAYRAGKSMS